MVSKSSSGLTPWVLGMAELSTGSKVSWEVLNNLFTISFHNRVHVYRLEGYGVRIFNWAQLLTEKKKDVPAFASC